LFAHHLLFTVLQSRNDFLRYRFRFMTSSGSGSDFWQVTIPAPVPVPGPVIFYKENID
jgi:hypothetical protein